MGPEKNDSQDHICKCFDIEGWIEEEGKAEVAGAFENTVEMGEEIALWVLTTV